MPASASAAVPNNQRSSEEPVPSRGGDCDQQRDDHDADSWGATGNHGGRNERGRQRSESHAGSSTIMRHPVGSACSAWIVPPCSSTIQRAIASPRPAPPRSAERARSER